MSENYEEQIEMIIDLLGQQFNPEDTEDYKSILTIIYNELFLNEDYLDSRKRYQIYELLCKAMGRIKNPKRTSEREEFFAHKKEYVDFMYDQTVSSHIKDGMKLALRQPRPYKREKC